MATMNTLESKSQQDCALKFIKACEKNCPPACNHYFSINAPFSEQEIVRRYNDFKKDKDYNSQ